MPIQIYKRQPNNTLGDAIIAGTQGFVQGRDMRLKREASALENAYKRAQTMKLDKELQSYNDPLPKGYVRLPNGDIKEDLTYMPDYSGFVGGGGNFPPGTTMKAGPFTIPVNRELTEAETNAVVGSKIYGQDKEGIKKDVNSDIYESKFPLPRVGRTVRQIAVGSGIPLLTAYDPKLQETQGRLNSIKRYVFTEGGKNLTTTEERIVYSLLNPIGKNNTQINTDLDRAIAILDEKAQAATGGANSILPGPNSSRSGVVPGASDISSLSDEELRKLAGMA